MLRVLKLGGNEIDDPVWLRRLVALARELVDAGEAPVLVHGGGKEIGQLQVALGGDPKFVGGLRVTDSTALRAATMVLCGAVSTRLVAALNAHGVDAIGLSGVDRRLITAVKASHPGGDLGAVGTPAEVRSAILRDLLADGALPVVAPICGDGQGGTLNVNADVLAGALAAALQAAEVVFISNVPGVLMDGVVLARLTVGEVRSLIDAGIISGGMIPKVEAALSALGQGVGRVRITSLDQVDGGTEILGQP